MYVRCPRCKSEISFEPQNTASLGETYKIKCPNCGATIGAKLPTKAQLLKTDKSNDVQVATDKKSKKVAKKSGAGRNVVMLLLSLIIIGISIFSYLYTKKVVNIVIPANIAMYIEPILYSFAGIQSLDKLITHFADFQLLFTTNIWVGVAACLQIGVFVFAALNFLASFICLCGKCYNRFYNLFTNLILAGCGVVTLFIPFIASGAATAELGSYFTQMIQVPEIFIVGAPNIGMLVLAAYTLLCFIFSLGFLASLKKKEAAPKAKAEKKAKKSK